MAHKKGEKSVSGATVFKYSGGALFRPDNRVNFPEHCLRTGQKKKKEKRAKHRLIV